ncbi:hypothetical protein C1646_688005 [Rhizophagus diaphanus]|nr:hypothetical protein C1646_688005 [Rhizophagus diaphanus] [Rhizophagus sp. MUCL 43196]
MYSIALVQIVELLTMKNCFFFIKLFYGTLYIIYHLFILLTTLDNIGQHWTSLVFLTKLNQLSQLKSRGKKSSFKLNFFFYC